MIFSPETLKVDQGP